MSEINDIKTGTFTVVSNGAAAVEVSLGFSPSTIELTNETTGDSQLFTVGVTAGVSAIKGKAAGTAVNYDSNNGGSEGGTIVNLTADGFSVDASLAGYNDTTSEVVRYVARK